MIEGLEGATADTLTGAAPWSALPWGLPALVLAIAAGLSARPEGRDGARQQRTGILMILALIAAGICARAMLGPRWQLGYGFLFGLLAVAGLASGRLWRPGQRAAAVAGLGGALVAIAAVALAIPRWTGATPWLAFAAAAVLGTLGVIGGLRVGGQRVPRSTE